MEYNDFPILNDEEYKFLQNKFSENISFNREEKVFSIFKTLNDLSASAPLLIVKSGMAIKASLIEAKKELDKMLENFNSTFNFKINQNEIKEKNLFNFLKNIVILQKNLIIWQKFEQKEYFRQFSMNALISVNEILFSLSYALENSSITTYRFM